MDQPLVSIIIPTYNREGHINKALDSVIAQTYAHWECIVVDDGSTDGTLSVLKLYKEQDSRILCFSRQRQPKGAPTCRNIGLQHAKGNYVIFLDSDDYLLPFCLEQRVAAFKNNNYCDFLVFPMGELKNDKVFKKEIPNSRDYLILFLSANLPWSIMCPIWEASFLKRLNGFTEGYPRFNDPELMVRALLYPKVRYKVLQKTSYDTVYVPSFKDQFVFKDKVFESLLMFIPDIVKLLDVKELPNLKRHLALFLHLWFKYFYVPLGKIEIKQSFKLILQFRSLKVITFGKAISLYLRLMLYVLSQLILKKSINKLTDKSLYL